jgi:hypothetical protein
MYAKMNFVRPTHGHVICIVTMIVTMAGNNNSASKLKIVVNAGGLFVKSVVRVVDSTLKNLSK